jgi:hypothetical protein
MFVKEKPFSNYLAIFVWAHRVLSSSVREINVAVTLIPENNDDKQILKRAGGDELDVVDSMLSAHLALYLESRFPGRSVLTQFRFRPVSAWRF